jgi:hypothetical protein
VIVEDYDLAWGNHRRFVLNRVEGGFEVPDRFGQVGIICDQLFMNNRVHPAGEDGIQNG